MATKILVKNVREPKTRQDGFRILVDRLWPRGMTREAVDYDAWEKELAPGTGLRKWFGHQPERWEGFRKKYLEELRHNEAVAGFVAAYRSHAVITLLFGAKDHEHNQAIVLQEYLQPLMNK